MYAKNIVVATDFSASSEAALALATSLARDTGAMLHIVHVKEPFAIYQLDSRYGEVPPCPDLETLKMVLEKVAPTDPVVPHHHWLITSDHVAKEILRIAQEVSAELLVIGTHGRKGLSRLLVGSVAEAVIRNARCPVLTIKHPQVELVEPIPPAATT